METEKAAPALLRGVRIVELCEGIPVAYCGRQFAAWGADLVRLEPAGGSWLRTAEPTITGPGDSRLSLQWEYLTADKTLQLFESASVAECRPIVEQADALITDWSIEDLMAAGLDVVALRAANPALVVLLFSDFGREGPYADFAATDLVIEALTGYLSFNGDADREPLRAPANVISYACGASAFVGTLAALLDARRTGSGQTVEVAAMEAVAALVQYTRTQYFGTPAHRRGNNGPPMLPCSDGHLFFNYLLEGSQSYLVLALGIDQSEVPSEPGQFEEFFGRYTRERSAGELFRAMGSMGTTCGTVQSLPQVLADEQLEKREFFADLMLPGTAAKFPGPPAQVRGVDLRTPRRARRFDGWTEREQRDVPPLRRAAQEPPLKGLRVVDVTTAWLGPYAGMLLADLGADVIKVEGPGRPDVWRAVSPEPPVARPGAHKWNVCHFFNSVNRGKRSLALDLNSQRGRELFLEVVRKADVLIENYSPRVMENFGLGHERLLQVNPRLVVVSFSGYGSSGPYRDFKAHGATIESVAGWVSLFGYEDHAPITMGEYPIDPVAGLHMAASAIVGLLGRNRDGTGVAIEGSMLAAAVSYIGDEVLLASIDPALPAPKGNRHRQMAPHGVFRCAGGDEWVAIACRDNGDWRRLGGVTGDARMQDSRYGTAEARLESMDTVEAMVTEWTRQRTARDVMGLLQQAGVPAGAVQSTSEALSDPHLGARAWFRPMNHPDLGTHLYYGFPWRFSESRLSAVLPPPRLGEDSRAILRDELGLTAAEIDGLVRDAVTGSVLGRTEGTE